MTPYNKENTIILYKQCLTNAPIEFVLWNFMSNKISSYKLDQNLDCILIDILPWKENQIVIFVNPNDEVSPKMIFYDIQNIF